MTVSATHRNSASLKQCTVSNTPCGIFRLASAAPQPPTELSVTVYHLKPDQV